MSQDLSNTGVVEPPPRSVIVAVGVGEGAAKGSQPSATTTGKPVFLELGSNQGDRLTHLRQGLRRLLGDGRLSLVAVSSLFESDPVACAGGPFLNAVVAVRTDVDPEELLREARAAERSAGRTGGRGEARPLDVDILFHGDVVLTGDDLAIPHPRLYDRPFVVAPLLEVCGDARDPRTGRRIRDEAGSAGALREGDPTRVAGPEWWSVGDARQREEGTGCPCVRDGA